MVQKSRPFYKFITAVYDDVERHSVICIVKCLVIYL